MRAAPCDSSELRMPLGMLEAVEYALCNNPQTRQAWANVKMQAALVGVQRSTYFPVVNGTVGVTRVNGGAAEAGAFDANPNSAATVRGRGLSMNWTLFDFGARRANLQNAKQLLAASSATRDAILQTVFLGTAEAYYDALAAQGTLEASRESETAASESFLAADAKHRAGIGTLADKLQAQTTHASAILNRVKKDGALKDALGTLAVSMGMSVNTPLTLSVDDTPLPDTRFMQSIDELIAEAKRNHPAVIAARAQLHAARSTLDAVRAEGLPSVALTGAISRQSQPLPFADNGLSGGRSIGIQINIPLFEGFGRSHRAKVAHAQMESRAADLASAEQQISLDVWKHYQSLRTETENLRTTEHLLHSAVQSFKVAQGRYKAGMGNILELLNAQSTLADVRQQRVQAFSTWRTAHLKFIAGLGKLGVWAIGPHADGMSGAAEIKAQLEPNKRRSVSCPVRRAAAHADATREEQEVLDVVNRWARAWSAQDLKTYLGFYSPTFQGPPGKTRKKWEEERHLRIAGKGHIDVRIEAPQMTVNHDMATVGFRQIYRSDRYTDTSRKTLSLMKRDGRWQIEQEYQTP